MKKLKSVASWAVAFGLLYLGLAYLGKFSERQSFVLAFLLAVLWEETTDFVRRPTGLYSPYEVRIFPNWPDLLTAFKLIVRREDWDAIEKWASDLPPAEYCVLRSGISFTVVQEGGSQQTLIYQNNRQSFATRIDFEEIVKPLEIFSVGDSSLFRADVALYIQPDLEGLGLGIDVPGSWWKTIRHECPAPLREDEAGPGRMKLLLSTIPLREFSETYCNNAEGLKLKLWIEPERKKYWAERDRQIAKFGWSRGDNNVAEWGRLAPELCLKHKFFSVMTYRI